MTLITIFLFTTLQVFAPERNELIILPGERICPYDQIFTAVGYIESLNNESALNLLEMAFGIVQIRCDKLNDYNRNNGTNYKLTDCFSVEISRKIFYWHCRGYEDMDLAIKKWNGSGPKTEKYLLRVKKLL